MNQRPECYEGLRRAVLEQHGPVAARITDDVYALAAAEHSGQYRKSGDPFVTHPVEVARLVCLWGRPLPSVCAALLHDVAPSRLRRLAELGVVDQDVTALVEAVARLDRTHRHDDERLPRAPRDACVIKLADRLHNARTWSFVPRHVACLKARQTLDVYTPLASTLGLADVAAELTSLSEATLAGMDVPAAGEESPEPILATTPYPRVYGASGRILGRAIMLLPPGQRVRYFEEWTAEVLALNGSRARFATAVGLHYSALRIRSSGRR